MPTRWLLVAAVWITNVIGGALRADEPTAEKRKGDVDAVAVSILYADAFEAVAGKDYRKASQLYAQLETLDPSNEDYQFRWAQCQSALGNKQAATKKMELLAPRGKPGYPPAHYWLAEQAYLSGLRDAAANEMLQWRLERAIEGEGDYVFRAHAMLGTVYLDLGKLEDAERELKRVVKWEPGLGMTLAEVHVRQKRVSDATDDARRVIEAFRGHLELDPRNERALLGTAQAMMFLRRFDEAIALLEPSASDSKRIRLALGQVCFEGASVGRRANEITIDRERDLLAQSLIADPFNPKLLRYSLVQLKANDAHTAMIRELLSKVDDQSKSSGSANVLLAMDATWRGKTEDVASMLARAEKSEPRTPRLIAELGISAVNNSPSDHALAGDLLNTGVKQWPDNAYLRHARAAWNARQKKWAEAVEDLDIAVKSKSHENDFGVHKLYVTAYDELGRSADADKYQKRLKELGAAAGVR